MCTDEDFHKQFFSISTESFDKVFGINLKSVFFICQYACKYFIDNKINGNILNICSTEGFKDGLVPYGLSKNALISFTRGLGKKMISEGIVINGIAPGATNTKMMRNNELDYSYDKIPSKRMTSPVEVANLAVFMLSDMGKQMPGQVVTIDGGESLF